MAREKCSQEQGAKKVILTACHSGKLKLAFTSPGVIPTSPKNFLTSRIDFTVLLDSNSSDHLPVGQVNNRTHQPDSKSTSPGLSDTTFYARCRKDTELSGRKHLSVLQGHLFHSIINFASGKTSPLTKNKLTTLFNVWSKRDLSGYHQMVE